MSAIFGEMLSFEQERGEDIRLKVYGDEFYARYFTSNGYPVVYDSACGLFCYAMYKGDEMISSGVDISQSPPLVVQNNLKESVGNSKYIYQRESALIGSHKINENSTIRCTLGSESGLLEGRRVCNGEVLGLTVLVEFANVSSKVSLEHVDAMLNHESYNAFGNSCSVRRYFQLVSNNKLNYCNRVVGPVRLSRKRNYYRKHLLVEEAMDIVVNDLKVDLLQFDSRKEGIIDAINFLYAGRTQYHGNLWPHISYMPLNYGGVRMDSYMIGSYGRRESDLSIGTFCHETGHLLCRFPDLYDYGFRDGDFVSSQGLGYYCIMGSGNHLAHGKKPSPVCGYLRDLAGWTENQILLNTGGHFEAFHGEYGTLLKYQTSRINEYFIVENRSRLGLDSKLPSSGLAVYHCDTLGSNEWQGGAVGKHFQCSLLQADGRSDLEKNRNAGDNGDLFGEGENVVLSDSTNPSSLRWDNTDSGLIISKVSAPGEVIKFSCG